MEEIVKSNKIQGERINQLKLLTFINLYFLLFIEQKFHHDQLAKELNQNHKEITSIHLDLVMEDFILALVLVHFHLAFLHQISISLKEDQGLQDHKANNQEHHNLKKINFCQKSSSGLLFSS